LKKQDWNIKEKTKTKCLNSLIWDLRDLFTFLNDNFNHKKHVIEYGYAFGKDINYVSITVRNKTKEEKQEAKLP